MSESRDILTTYYPRNKQCVTNNDSYNIIQFLFIIKFNNSEAFPGPLISDKYNTILTFLLN